MILFVVGGKGGVDLVEWGYHGPGRGVALKCKHSDSLYSLSFVCFNPST